MRPINPVATTAKITVIASENPCFYSPCIAINGSKWHKEGRNKGNIRTNLQDKIVTRLHLELSLQKKPPIIKIIKGDRAFPESSGRETIEPRKAAKTT